MNIFKTTIQVPQNILLAKYWISIIAVLIYSNFLLTKLLASERDISLSTIHSQDLHFPDELPPIIQAPDFLKTTILASSYGKNNFLFSWNKQTNAVNYVVEVAQEVEFKLPILETTTKHIYFSFSKSPDQDYYWRVRSVDEFHRLSDWSAGQSIGKHPIQSLSGSSKKLSDNTQPIFMASASDNSNINQDIKPDTKENLSKPIKNNQSSLTITNQKTANSPNLYKLAKIEPFYNQFSESQSYGSSIHLQHQLYKKLHLPIDLSLDNLENFSIAVGLKTLFFPNKNILVAPQASYRYQSSHWLDLHNQFIVGVFKRLFVEIEPQLNIALNQSEVNWQVPLQGQIALSSKWSIGCGGRYFSTQQTQAFLNLSWHSSSIFGYNK